jgi:hypothetical protein
MSTDQTRNHIPNGARSGGKKTDAAAATQAGRSDRLATLAEGTPKFKSGQILGLWPQITDALARGHKLKQIWECLSHDGLEVSYSRFRHVIADLKRSADPLHHEHLPRPERLIKIGMSNEIPERDPVENLRSRLNNRPGFHWDESPPDLKKLVGTIRAQSDRSVRK